MRTVGCRIATGMAAALATIVITGCAPRLPAGASLVPFNKMNVPASARILYQADIRDALTPGRQSVLYWFGSSSRMTHRLSARLISDEKTLLVRAFSDDDKKDMTACNFSGLPETSEGCDLSGIPVNGKSYMLELYLAPVGKRTLENNANIPYYLFVSLQGTDEVEFITNSRTETSVTGSYHQEQ